MVGNRADGWGIDMVYRGDGMSRSRYIPPRRPEVRESFAEKYFVTMMALCLIIGIVRLVLWVT